MAKTSAIISEIKKAIGKALGATYVSSILRHFTNIRKAYFAGDWETCCAKGGKFVEALLKGLHFYTTQNRLKRIKVGTEIDRLINLPRNNFDPSIRLLIPRICRSLYYIASDRGARHDITGFNPSRMDAEIVSSQASFLLAELVRLFHPGNLSGEQALTITDELIQRKIPLITSVFDVRRVLNTSLKYSDQVLLLLYDSYPNPVQVKDLFNWVEHKNITDFKRKVLKKLHEKRFLEYRDDLCKLLPPGLEYVDENFGQEY